MRRFLWIISIALFAACGGGQVEANSTTLTSTTATTEPPTTTTHATTTTQPVTTTTSPIDVGSVVSEYWLLATDSYAEDFAQIRFKVLIAGEEQNLEKILDRLGMPAGTLQRLMATRALDGTQMAESEWVTMSWTYHPDDGMNIIIQRKP
jgi:hypothetical protein